MNPKQFAGPVGQPFADNVSIRACLEQGSSRTQGRTRSAGSCSCPFEMGEENYRAPLKHGHATNLCGGINIFSSVFSLCLIIRKILLAFPAAAEQ